MKNGADWTTGNGYFGYNSQKGNHLTGWYDQVYDNNLEEHGNNITVSNYSKSYDIYLKVVLTADWGHQLAYTVVEAGTEVTF